MAVTKEAIFNTMSNGADDTGEVVKPVIRPNVLKVAREAYKINGGNINDASKLTADELFELYEHPREPVNLDTHPLKLALGKVRTFFSNIHFPQFQKREQKTQNPPPLVKSPV